MPICRLTRLGQGVGCSGYAFGVVAVRHFPGCVQPRTKILDWVVTDTATAADNSNTWSNRCNWPELGGLPILLGRPRGMHDVSSAAQQLDMSTGASALSGSNLEATEHKALAWCNQASKRKVA